MNAHNLTLQDVNSSNPFTGPLKVSEELKHDPKDVNFKHTDHIERVESKHKSVSDVVDKFLYKLVTDSRGVNTIRRCMHI